MTGKEELLALARVADLPLPEERIAGVLSNLQRMEQIAAAVNQVEVGPQDELGPEWRP